MTTDRKARPYCTRWLKGEEDCPPQKFEVNGQYVNIDLLYPNVGRTGRWVCATCFKPSRSFYRALLTSCVECNARFSQFSVDQTTCKKCCKIYNLPYFGWADVTKRLLEDPLLQEIRDARTYNADWRKELAQRLGRTSI